MFNGSNNVELSRYETTDFEGQMMALYDQMEPLYKELHAYIRFPSSAFLTWKLENWKTPSLPFDIHMIRWSMIIDLSQ